MHAVSSNQPDIRKKIRPKNEDKGGYVALPRAAPRPTRAPGPCVGVRPRPGEGKVNTILFVGFASTARLDTCENAQVPEPPVKQK